MIELKKAIKSIFPAQLADEKVFLVTRAHWATLFVEILVWLLFAVLPILFDNFIVPNFPVLDQNPYLQIIQLVKSLYFMYLVAGIFSIWIIYYLNYQIVTNKRVVDVTQRSLLHQTTSELNLERIQDVTAEVKGLLGNLFNYGNVYVQTAGEVERFQFDNVPNPHDVEKMILDLYEQLPPVQKGLGNNE